MNLLVLPDTFRFLHVKLKKKILGYPNIAGKKIKLVAGKKIRRENKRYFLSYFLSDKVFFFKNLKI